MSFSLRCTAPYLQLLLTTYNHCSLPTTTAQYLQPLLSTYSHCSLGASHGLQVTEGPHTGKLALLDFGLVAQIPESDREAMVSATIHLANRDWNGLISDFIDLQFLPASSDRGLIIPVMDK